MILNRSTLGAVFALVVAAAVAGAWFKGRAAGEAACEARWAKRVSDEQARALADERRMQGMADSLSQRISDEISQIRIEHKTVQQTIRDEIREVPVYSECRISDRLLDALNTHRAAADTGPRP